MIVAYCFVQAIPTMSGVLVLTLSLYGILIVASIYMLKMIIKYTRQCLIIYCARRINAIQMIEKMTDVMLINVLLEYI